MKIELRKSQEKIRTVEASFFRTIENNNRTTYERNNSESRLRINRIDQQQFESYGDPHQKTLNKDFYSIKVDEDSAYDYKSQTSKPKSQRNKSQGQLREVITFRLKIILTRLLEGEFRKA